MKRSLFVMAVTVMLLANGAGAENAVKSQNRACVLPTDEGVRR
jgi:hypothetical protein